MIALAGDSGSLHVLFGRAYRDANDMPSRAGVSTGSGTRSQDAACPLLSWLARLAVNEWKPTPETKAEIEKELALSQDFLANYMLGFIAASERQYDVADKYLKIATEINPNWPEPWLYLGLNEYAQGDKEHAEEMFRKAIELTGQDESRSNFQIRRAYVDLGRILANSGRQGKREVHGQGARAAEQNDAAEPAERLRDGARRRRSAAAIVPLNTQSEAEAAPIYRAARIPLPT